MPFTHPAFDGAKAAALPVPAHPDDAAVDALATLMKAKLAKQRAKGYGGWDTDCTRERLSELLRGHVDKGDPVDVANFCAFLSARGEGIAPETSTQTPSQLQARVTELEAALREAVTLASTDDAVTAESDLWEHLCKWGGRQMIHLTCQTPERHFWGVFATPAEALRTLYEAMETAYPFGPPDRMAVKYCPVASATTEAGTLFEEAAC